MVQQEVDFKNSIKKIPLGSHRVRSIFDRD